mmetsp:Transcript_107981/g.311226  ORF Transcript_107981/g.311226 Transcript_107981/m.311226 type:complete len:391 (+) Transcript_107981:58-1230(+)
MRVNSLSECGVPARGGVAPIVVLVIRRFLLDHRYCVAGMARVLQLLVFRVGFGARHVWRLQLTACQFVPIQAVKELVRLDRCEAVGLRAQASRWVLRQQSPQNGDRVLGGRIAHEVVGKGQRRLEDLFENVRFTGNRAMDEWKLAQNKLIQTNAQAPQVRDGRVACVPDHLWRHKHGRPPSREGTALDPHRDAEVDQLQVAMAVDEAVLGLQVEVSDAARVQELECQQNRTRIELRLEAVEQTEHVQDVQQLAPRDQLHQEVHLFRAGEGTHELHEERMVDLEEDATLVDDGLLLVLLDDGPLPHTLQRVAHACASMPHHLHDAEATAADDADELQVLHLHLRVLQVDAVLQVLEAHALDDFRECVFAHNPQFRPVLDSNDVRRPGLVEE